MMLKEYHKKALVERRELHKRARKCNHFICNQGFLDLDARDQELLREQNSVMWQYYEVLTKRISRFNK